MEETLRIYPGEQGLSLMQTKEAVLNNADALVICTEWRHFHAPDFDLIKEKLNGAVIIDGRNLYDPQMLKDKGFFYSAFGRGEAC
jgi:UDPglucose 6-dehydrogenase